MGWPLGISGEGEYCVWGEEFLGVVGGGKFGGSKTLLVQTGTRKSIQGE